MVNIWFEVLLSMDESTFAEFIHWMMESELNNVMIPESVYLALSAIALLAED